VQPFWDPRGVTFKAYGPAWGAAQTHRTSSKRNGPASAPSWGGLWGARCWDAPGDACREKPKSAASRYPIIYYVSWMSDLNNFDRGQDSLFGLSGTPLGYLPEPGGQKGNTSGCCHGLGAPLPQPNAGQSASSRSPERLTWPLLRKTINKFLLTLITYSK
jgi:hypothetical protein